MQEDFQMQSYHVVLLLEDLQLLWRRLLRCLLLCLLRCLRRQRILLRLHELLNSKQRRQRRVKHYHWATVLLLRLLLRLQRIRPLQQMRLPMVKEVLHSDIFLMQMKMLRQMRHLLRMLPNFPCYIPPTIH